MKQSSIFLCFVVYISINYGTIFFCRFLLSSNLFYLVQSWYFKFPTKAPTKSPTRSPTISPSFCLIPSLVTTGTYEGGAPVPAGTAMPSSSWTLIQRPDNKTNPSMTLYSVDTYSPQTNPPVGMWIGPNDDPSGAESAAVGIFTFRLTFSLANVQLNALSVVSALLSVDNVLLDVLLNGQSLNITKNGMGSGGTQNYETIVPDSISGPFEQDTNTLDFIVLNVPLPGNPNPQPTDGNPVALYVDFPVKGYECAPSAAPSHSPSIAPIRPSALPTTSPSSVPTKFPSSSPNIPSGMPSSHPISPSAFPTVLPTATPSTIPSIAPSAVPSLLPSVAPTAVPSTLPSVTPTAVPSTLPSVTPTAAPSTLPSMAPTAAPSTLPSEAPSAVPSLPLIPSVYSSSLPATSGTIGEPQNPTITPSDEPTAKPSFIPTSIPTLSPSSLADLLLRCGICFANLCRY